MIKRSGCDRAESLLLTGRFGAFENVEVNADARVRCPMFSHGKKLFSLCYNIVLMKMWRDWNVYHPPNGRNKRIFRPHGTVGWNCMKSMHSFQKDEPLSHEREWVSERMSATERASEAREWVSEWTTKRTSKWPTTLCVDIIWFLLNVGRSDGRTDPHVDLKTKRFSWLNLIRL